MIGGDFNTHLSTMVGNPTEINKKMEGLNNIIDQLDQTHMYRTPYLATAENKIFSRKYGTFSMINYILLSHMLSH